MWSTLPRKKEIRQDYLAPYCISKTSSNRDSITFLRRLFHWMTVLTKRKQKKKKILISWWNCPQCNMYPLSLVFSMWLDCFCPFCSCPLSWREIIAIRTLLRISLSMEILLSFLRIKGITWQKKFLRCQGPNLQWELIWVKEAQQLCILLLNYFLFRYLILVLFLYFYL